MEDRNVHTTAPLCIRRARAQLYEAELENLQVNVSIRVFYSILQDRHGYFYHFSARENQVLAAKLANDDTFGIYNRVNDMREKLTGPDTDPITVLSKLNK